MKYETAIKLKFARTMAISTLVAACIFKGYRMFETWADKARPMLPIEQVDFDRTIKAVYEPINNSQGNQWYVGMQGARPKLYFGQNAGWISPGTNPDFPTNKDTRVMTPKLVELLTQEMGIQSEVQKEMYKIRFKENQAKLAEQSD